MRVTVPFFIKAAGVPPERIATVHAFLQSEKVRSPIPIEDGHGSCGLVPFIELLSSELNKEYGTYTLDFKIHTAFDHRPSEYSRANGATARVVPCPRRVLDGLFDALDVFPAE